MTPPPPRRHTGRGGRGDRRRTLSQNLLRDPRAIASFLAALPPADGLPAVEVGTGDGALTRDLAAHFGTLTTWELDPAMAATAQRRLRDVDGIRFETGDFLASAPPRTPFHLAGNIPFGRTTPIVTWVLAAPALRTATLITQWEFARKRAGDFDRWTRTTAMSWPWFAWELGARIPRRSFAPVPATDAGVLRIVRRPTPLLPAGDRARWERDVDAAFIGRGGSLFASLAEYHPRRALEAAFARAGLDRDVVVGFVHPDALVTVFRALGAPRR
ncbi:ribosomal RNA small subunit methyltransferase A [Jatrophihabitans sp. YIM 134969]